VIAGVSLALGWEAHQEVVGETSSEGQKIGLDFKDLAPIPNADAVLKLQ
jgi:hypothetical protein